MVDTQKLCKRIDESGLKKYYIASKVGLTTYGLQKKINNQTQFKANEIEELCIILKIKTLEEKEKNFFCKKCWQNGNKKVAKKRVNTHRPKFVFTQMEPIKYRNFLFAL